MSGAKAVEMELPPGGGLTSLSMAGLAEGHQVIIRMGTASFRRDDMMDFVNRNQTPGLKALLAKRMLGYVQVTDGAPASAINLVMLRGTLSSVIFPSREGFMLQAKTAFPDRIGTAGISAGSEGKLGHG